MKASQFHIATLKEAPTDAEIVSHRLMTRAGMIRKLAGGIYNYMPMGLRSIRKIEAIIRDEMNAAGAIELLMPVVQPAELWMESGRWEKYGPELLRVQDRHGRDFIVQPTSEEVITDIARQELRSYRQLPRNFYHIQTKFRDERRPRFGVMRGREFTMKDAYSFDRSREAAMASYRAMFEAYTRTFNRMGLTFRAVAADTGAIGGSASHEFQVIAETGEDAIAFCRGSEFAANIELAEALPLLAERATPAESLQKIATPDCTKCESVAQLLEQPLEQTVKSLVIAIDRREPVKDGSEDSGSPARIIETRICLLLVRGDHDLNEVKAGKVPGLEGFRFATESEIVEHFGCVPGYIGPIGIPRQVRVIADRTVARMSDFVCGANDPGFHYTGANWDRDCPEPEVADLRNVRAGDPSPDSQGVLEIQRGIEVGHVFYLGTKYSDAMNARFVDEDGQSKSFEMGCYGIGVTRLLGAAIEQNHDERGIIWPAAIAPFEVVITPLGMDRSDAVRGQAESLHRQLLEAGLDVILDDRGERPGAMFADWELIGVPVRITVGERGLKEGVIEVQPRRAREALKLAPGEVLAKVLELLRRED
jgi:prolyl-tRNA synthetase